MPYAHTMTVTPEASCTMLVTATFDAQLSGSASDWAAGPYVCIRVHDGSSYDDGHHQPLSLTRLPYTLQASFDVVADVALTVAAEVSVGPGQTVTVWNISLKAEQIKR